MIEKQRHHRRGCFSRATGCRDLLADPPDDLVVVHKDGATTGRTTGLLDPVVVSDQTATRQYTQGWWIIGENDRPFALDGDSGSVVLDEAGAAAGMVVAVDKAIPPLTLRDRRRGPCEVGQAGWR